MSTERLGSNRGQQRWVKAALSGDLHSRVVMAAKARRMTVRDYVVAALVAAVVRDGFGDD